MVSHLNEEMLKEIAAAGDGFYVRANNINVGLQYILDELNKLEKKEFESKVFTDYEDHFQPFIMLAICMMLLETFITRRKNKVLGKIELFKHED